MRLLLRHGLVVAIVLRDGCGRGDGLAPEPEQEGDDQQQHDGRSAQLDQDRPRRVAFAQHARLALAASVVAGVAHRAVRAGMALSALGRLVCVVAAEARRLRVDVDALAHHLRFRVLPKVAGHDGERLKAGARFGTVRARPELVVRPRAGLALALARQWIGHLIVVDLADAVSRPRRAHPLRCQEVRGTEGMLRRVHVAAALGALGVG